MKPVLLALVAASSLHAQIPIAPGAELKLAADGYKFTAAGSTEAPETHCDPGDDRTARGGTGGNP